MAPTERLAFALDVPSQAEAEAWLDRLTPEVGLFKVGLELFVAEGPGVVRAVHGRQRACFLDLKLHDIPETVARAAARAAGLGARYLTVHAANGPKGLEAASRAVEGTDTTLLAVTALTSLSGADLAAIGVLRPMADHVLGLARMALDAGVHGFVCSPEECAPLRAALGDGPLLVVPGIRPPGTAAGDQARIATPATALEAGADVLVVGRPIRDAQDPVAAAKAIAADLARHAPRPGRRP